MSLTMKSTVKEISALDEPSASKLPAWPPAALKGRARKLRRHPLPDSARLCARHRRGGTIDAETFAEGLEAGAKTAYKAVMSRRRHHPDRHPRDRGGFRRYVCQASGRPAQAAG
ncbi:MAG: hypothetical protein ACLUI3_10040 [Christensenellales bacterium]